MAEEYKTRVLIVDDVTETRENIRKILQFESDIEVIGVAGTGAEAVQLSKELKPEVILMDINMPDMDGISATERIKAESPAIQIVILSVQNDANYMRQAMLAGVRDYLAKPPDMEELVGAIRRAGVKAREESLKEDSANAVRVSRIATDKLELEKTEFGRIITVYSPKGGVGGTTIAANLAVALKSKEKSVIVVDGRLQYGDLGLYFNLKGRNSILDLAPRGSELDTEVINDVVLNHEETGVDILTAPPRPEQAEEITGAQFSQILKHLRRLYSFVVVDSDSSLSETSLAAIDVSDLLVLITSQDITAIKNIRLFFDLADAIGISRHQIVLVLNQFDKRRRITPERIEEISDQKVDVSIPLDDKYVVRAMERGTPFVLQVKSAPVSKAIFLLASGIKKRLASMLEGQE
jgi:pilus assembly protein CpaE